MAEINLNDKNNLNPNPDDFKQMSEGQRKEAVDNWNRNPATRENDFKVIDERTHKPVSIPKLKLMEWLAVAGAVALVIIALLFGYNFVKTGKVFPQAVCALNVTNEAPVSICAPNITTQAAVCNLSCGTYNITFTPIINVTVIGNRS